MRDAVIVSTARTPIGKAYRGAFNNTTPQTLAGHAIEHAVKRAGVDPVEIRTASLVPPCSRAIRQATSPVRPRSARACPSR